MGNSKTANTPCQVRLRSKFRLWFVKSSFGHQCLVMSFISQMLCLTTLNSTYNSQGSSHWNQKSEVGKSFNWLSGSALRNWGDIKKRIVTVLDWLLRKCGGSQNQQNRLCSFSNFPKLHFSFRPKRLTVTLLFCVLRGWGLHHSKQNRILHRMHFLKFSHLFNGAFNGALSRPTTCPHCTNYTNELHVPKKKVNTFFASSQFSLICEERRTC